MRVPAVALLPLSDREREVFIDQEVRDYAEQQVRDAGWAPAGALERARDALAPVLERAHASAVAAGQRRWSAIGAGGESVGWVWVTPPSTGIAGDAAFLDQITVKASVRGHGYGRAMLAALESVLGQDGVSELRLHVHEANGAAGRLYAGAGYEQVGRSGAMRQLRKRLVHVPVNITPSDAGHAT